MAPCVDPADCGRDTTCRQFTCDGTCGTEHAAANTPCDEGGGAVCDGNGNCVAATCTDGVRGQGETDVDCGGPDCAPCADGARCDGPDDCASGFCPADDGVCCDAACDGTCEACLTIRTGSPDGTCAFVAAGQDPDGDCATAGETCDGAGTCGACGADPAPPGGPCPSECDSCANGVCHIACSGGNSCSGDTINCPQGFACDLDCSGNSSCAGAEINCPDTYACTVAFNAQNSGRDATINCTDGSCELTCNVFVDLCLNTTLNCGSNACTATCLDPSDPQPTVNCGASCGCTPC